MRSSDDLLACPRCAGALRGLRCDRCPAQYAAPGGIPDLRLPNDGRTESVRGFYSESPFPGYPPGESFSALRARAATSEFARSLDAAIPGDATVLEMGCGTGQLSLFLASAQRLVVGADLTRAALELGHRAAERFGVQGVRFVETDLHSPGLRGESFDAVARLVRPGGVLVVGLYNAFARLPLRARRLVARLSGYRFIPGDPVLKDRGAEPDRRKSWLRDQYQHVVEHRHTLGEVRGWFRSTGMTYLRAFPS